MYTVHFIMSNVHASLHDHIFFYVRQRFLNLGEKELEVFPPSYPYNVSPSINHLLIIKLPCIVCMKQSNEEKKFFLGRAFLRLFWFGC